MLGGDFYYLMGAKVHFERPTDSKNIGQRPRDSGVQLTPQVRPRSGHSPFAHHRIPALFGRGFLLSDGR